jgi:hypothetical protein
VQLQSLFAKPVDRPIEGVIKADDDASLRDEVEEYVLTNEVEKRLEAFFDAYNRYQNAMGVWISGFFGSGKSHLLKILALLLANRIVEGLAVAASFLSKCQDNKILAASIHKAVSIPSKSILFNIDQKADVISKTQVDALLSVFVKVFDESCGYYGKQGYIAHFERQLDEDGEEKVPGTVRAVPRRGRPPTTPRPQAAGMVVRSPVPFGSPTSGKPPSRATRWSYWTGGTAGPRP